MQHGVNLPPFGDFADSRPVTGGSKASIRGPLEKAERSSRTLTILISYAIRFGKDHSAHIREEIETAELRSSKRLVTMRRLPAMSPTEYDMIVPWTARHALLRFAVLALTAMLSDLIVSRPAIAAGLVGDGSSASCTEATLRTAVSAGGAITFNCGPNPTTIVITAPISVSGKTTTIDGGGKIALQGSNSRILEYASNVSADTPLTIQNITLTKGRVNGDPSAGNGLNRADPNGAAIYAYNNGDLSFPPKLNLVNVQLIDNDASMTRYEDAHGGGAIFMRDGFLDVRGSIFADNDCANCTGAAIQLMGGTLSIDGSTFTNNKVTGSPGGGAIYQDSGWRADWSGDATITNSTFRANTAQGSGGAIKFIPYRATNLITIDRSSFADNASVGGSDGQGGAIYAYTSRTGINDDPGDAVIEIRNSLFGGNWAKDARGIGLGGALWLVKTTVRVSNSTIVNNTAFGDTDWNPKGGAMYLGDPRNRAEISNSTIAYNHAGGTGGGIAVMNGNARVRNTIIAHNTAANAGQTDPFRQQCNEPLFNGGNNLQFPAPTRRDGTMSCFSKEAQPPASTFQDSKLAPLANNGGPTQTMAITAGSPAIDNGANCETTDQRGIPRPQGRACDIGAFELVQSLSLTPSFVKVGSGDTIITVYGAGFSASSKVLVDGQERPTQLANATQLRVTLARPDLETIRNVPISVSGIDLPPATLRVVAFVGNVRLPLARK